MNGADDAKRPLSTIDALYKSLIKSVGEPFENCGGRGKKYVIVKLGINGSGKSTVMPEIRRRLGIFEYVDVNTDDIVHFLRLHYPLHSGVEYMTVRHKTRFMNVQAKNIRQLCQSQSQSQSQSQNQNQNQNQIQSQIQSQSQIDRRLAELLQALKSSGIVGNDIVQLIIDKALSCHRNVEIESTGLSIFPAWMESLAAKGHTIVYVFPFVDVDNIFRRTAARNQHVQDYRGTLANYLRILENIINFLFGDEKNNFFIVDNNASTRGESLKYVCEKLNAGTRICPGIDYVKKELAGIAGFDSYHKYTSYVSFVLKYQNSEWSTRKPSVTEVNSFLSNAHRTQWLMNDDQQRGGGKNGPVETHERLGGSIVYVGPRGGKYVKRNGIFSRIHHHRLLTRS